jgi:ornithine cyclodeaminase/alanine dehydrogenase
MRDITYLNSDHLDDLNLDMAEIVDMLESVFRLKAAGAVGMPPKIFFHHDGDRFYSAMTSSCQPLGFAGCKWQSGDPVNPSRGLPNIQGLYILNDNNSGEMLAVMDAGWITGKRTAAASALVARFQARKSAEELAILGCGVQGRAHLEALSGELPSLAKCRVFDIAPQVQNDFVAALDCRHNNIRVSGCDSAEQAVRGADVIVTGGPITHVRKPLIPSEWVKGGALLVTIDYDSYVTDECIAAMDIVLTDDREQIEDARRNEGKFTGVTRLDTDIAAMISVGRGIRQDDAQRIMAFNLGIALEDVATAAEIYRLALEKKIGISLPA